MRDKNCEMAQGPRVCIGGKSWQKTGSLKSEAVSGQSTRAVDYEPFLSSLLFFCPQILFLGPLMQLSMDCPCDLADGLKVVLGESSGPRVVY